MLKLLLLTMTISHLLCLKSFTQSITLDKQSFAYIVINDSIISGSGFVMSSPNHVVTCAHVFDTSNSVYFVPFKGSNKYKLKLLKYDIQYDVALLVSDSQITSKPLLPELIKNTTPLQHIFYLGYDISESNQQFKVIKVHQAYVEAVGVVQSGFVTTNFLEFVGSGIPGYSGGPVFNDDGKVIGIMREAWLKQGLKGGNATLMNRAYSILPLFSLK